MSWSINFSVALQTEILSTETSDFLKQMIIFESFNSMLLDHRSNTSCLSVT